MLAFSPICLKIGNFGVEYFYTNREGEDSRIGGVGGERFYN